MGLLRPLETLNRKNSAVILLSLKNCFWVLLSVLTCHAQEEEFEPLGPSSRRTGLVISEIMYHPADRPDGARLEFIELFNSNPFPEEISGYSLAGLAYTFPFGTIIGSNSFLVVARFPDDVRQVYGLAHVLGPLSNNIPNGQASISLLHRSGAVLLEATYSDRAPWPLAPDGAGHSLVLARPSYGERDPRAWAASSRVGGSPGALDVYVPSALGRLKINEFRAHSFDGEQDFIELYNYSHSQLDISGCSISHDDAAYGFMIPDGTVIGPRSFAVFYEPQLEFPLSGVEGKLFLWNSARDRVLDATRYWAQEQGLSTGRFPDGAVEMYNSLAPSPGFENPRPPVPAVLINEIHYQSVLDVGSREFIELHNPGTTKVDLTGWRLEGMGIPFLLHPIIAPGGYLALGGWFDSQLSNSGERLVLLKPIVVVEPDPVTFEPRSNFVYAVVDEVTYGTGGRWGKWIDGGGSSLEATDPRANRRVAPSWADSDPVEPGRWLDFEHTGVVDHGAGVCDGLDVMLLGRGEALLDNVEVFVQDGANLVANADFEQSAEGWFSGGNHERSSWAPGKGASSKGALYLRATGRGDPGPNRVYTRLTSLIQTGAVATIRGQFRWLRGRPRILLRLKGNYLEAEVSYPSVSIREGTPGLRNSRARNNAAPAIFDVTHHPVLPQADEPVVIRARLDDPDGVQSVAVAYRVDPSTARLRAPMNDGGTDSDEVAGDGIYTATIPGQPAGTLVAFAIEANDAATAAATAFFPDDAPDRECLIRFGEPRYDNPFATYRLWMTQATHDTWAQREKLSNERLDVTFVYADHRVIYNAGAVFSGSPATSQSYDSPTGTLCSYDLDFPDDDRLLGATEVVLDFPTRDPTAQRQQLMYWFFEQLDLPFNYRRYMNLFVNGVGQLDRSGFGVTGAIYEDAQQPNSDVLREWFPGDNNGDLLKAEDWIEFSDTGNIQHVTPNTLERFTTTGEQKKTARYRWNWRPRSFALFTHPYRTLFQLVDVMGASYEQTGYCADALIDADLWMSTFALNDLASNWDSFGNRGGKNTFLYKPVTGPWKLLSWDFDAGLGIWGADADAPLFEVTDPTVAVLYTQVALLRSYWRAAEEGLNRVYRSDVVGTVLDTRFAALASVGVDQPDSIKAFIDERRPMFTARVAELQADFGILSHPPFAELSDSNYIALIGTAPLKVKTLTVNRRAYPVTWVDLLIWQVNLALTNGTNHLIVQGWDRLARPVDGASNYIAIVYLPTTGNPTTEVVLNEVLNYPPVCGAEFMELYNRSSSNAFDISWLGSYDYAPPFQNGIVLPPHGFAALAQERWAFWDSFGCSIPVAGMPPVRLFDCLYYDPVWGCYWNHVCPDALFPWPQITLDVSLQLIDPEEHNWHPGNWRSDYAVGATPGRTNSVHMNLPPFPELWLNEIVPLNATGIRDRSGTPEPWLELLYLGSNTLELNDFRLSETPPQLDRWAFPPGSTIDRNGFRLVWLDGQPNETTSQEWHASFRPPANYGIVSLSRQVDDQNILIDLIKYPDPRRPLDEDQVYGIPSPTYNWQPSYSASGIELSYPTALATNTGVRPFTNQVIFINEWMASNTRIADPADGALDDWFEIFNNQSNLSVNLAGYTLTDDLRQTNQFTIPEGFTIPPRGFLLVWADEQVEQSQPGQALHVNFRLSRDGESLGLFDPAGRRVDALTFGRQTNDISQGRCGDASQNIVYMTRPTPKRPNICDLIPRCPVADINIEFYRSIASLIWFRIPETPCWGEYVLQCKDELRDRAWTDITGSLFQWQVGTENGWRYYWFYDFWIGHSKQRFYRVDLRLTAP
jgi:hypothetical protein